MQVRCTKDGALMPARKKPEQFIVGETGPEIVAEDAEPTVDRGPGPDQAETRASRWDTPRST